jgi:uncharacterized membrane-anchored protein YjiN (DUF445 family)
METPPARASRTDRWARNSLLLALLVAIGGAVLGHRAPFWGGLLFAFGEAALVGGLADWFAVRALFAHPFGIPFPHTAIIPRNRSRIIREIRQLVLHEWLPLSLLIRRVEEFDFVGQGLLPVMEPLRPHLRGVLRSVGQQVLDDLEPTRLADFLARGLAGAVDAERIGPFLSDLTRRAREQRWLEPVLEEWVRRLLAWAESPHSRTVIHRRLQHASETYKEQGWFKRVTVSVAEVVGGLDLDAAARVLQEEVRRFAVDQLADESPAQGVVREGLENIERRLREDPAFLADVRRFLLETSERGTLTLLLEPVLSSLRQEARCELEGDSVLLDHAMAQVDAWVEKLRTDPELRERANAWCRHVVVEQVRKHHGLLGVLVEEQLGRLSEANLSALIQARVGEDLNWIRLNGTFVGGLVGVMLYLAFTLGRWLAGAG